MSWKALVAALLGAGLLVAALPITAAEPSAGSTPESEEEVAREYFSDLPLVTMQGDEVRFFSDVLKDRVVLISNFYTRCEGLSPRQGQVLAKLQGMLGDRLGREVFFVSITVDPEYDTPEKIREFAGDLGAGPGWIFLTGAPENVHEVNRRLGQRAHSPEEHNGIYLLGNVPTTLWVKLPMHATPPDLYRHLQRLLEDEGDPAGG